LQKSIRSTRDRPLGAASAEISTSRAQQAAASPNTEEHKDSTTAFTAETVATTPTGIKFATTKRTSTSVDVVVDVDVTMCIMSTMKYPIHVTPTTKAK
jgi:hypothetical protein